MRTLDDVQRHLKALGIYNGVITSTMNEKLKAAIRGFQRINGLKVDGIPGPKTQAALWPDMPERDMTPLTEGNSHHTWPAQRDVSKFYGAMGQNLRRLQLPYRMKLAWHKTKGLHSFLIHEKVHDSAARCFARIYGELGPSRIQDLGLDLFGGCLADPPRKMRGGSSWSMHSWAIAIDFDPARNQLRMDRSQARLGQTDAIHFWKIWEEEGWVSLGRTRNFDWMHVQAARL